jgi:hypothetical protein
MNFGSLASLQTLSPEEQRELLGSLVLPGDAGVGVGIGNPSDTGLVATPRTPSAAIVAGESLGAETCAPSVVSADSAADSSARADAAAEAGQATEELLRWLEAHSASVRRLP